MEHLARGYYIGEAMESASEDTTDRDRRRAGVGAGIIVALGLAMVALICLHVSHVNGPSYWAWQWRRVSPLRWYVGLAVAALPSAVAMAHPRLSAAASRQGVAIAIAMLMLSTFAMRLAAAVFLRDQVGTSFIVDTVKSPVVTSYYTDAAAVMSTQPQWLAHYPEFLQFTNLHTRSKPPGPMLYWMGVIKLLGYNDRAALAGGIGLGLLATLSVPGVYLTVRAFTRRPRAALLAAAFMAIAPGYVLFFPMFDPIYATFTCALVLLWHRAIQRPSVLAAVTFGLVLAGVVFWTYLLLAMGPALLLIGLISAGSLRRGLVATIKLGAVALATFALAYLVLWFATGFDPVATFQQAWLNQHQLISEHEARRTYPATIPWDVYDFLLGIGFTSIALAARFIASGWRRNDASAFGYGAVGVALPLLVALSGLIQTETSRVWMFMAPLWLIAIGLELERWPRRWTLAILLVQWLFTAAMGQNMELLPAWVAGAAADARSGPVIAFRS